MFNLQGWVPETNPEALKRVYINALLQSGFNILKEVEHHFTPFGYTGLWLLSESHFAIHTFPEEGKSYIELSSCIEQPFIKFKEIANVKENQQNPTD